MREAFTSSHLKHRQQDERSVFSVALLTVLTNLVLFICCHTCRRPSKVRCMVTHLLGWAPFVVMAVIRESSSSFFSFSFFTRLSIARFAKLSLSPPCRWHIRLCTMLRQASLLVGVFVIDILHLRFQPWGGFLQPSQVSLSEMSRWKCCWADAAKAFNNLKQTDPCFMTSMFNGELRKAKPMHGNYIHTSRSTLAQLGNHID